MSSSRSPLYAAVYGLPRRRLLGMWGWMREYFFWLLVLTVIPGLNCGQDLAVLLNELYKLIHQSAPCGAPCFPPRAVESCSGSLDRRINILSTSRVN